jgi:low affinity Fe/Cu permease
MTIEAMILAAGVLILLFCLVALHQNLQRHLLRMEQKLDFITTALKEQTQKDPGSQGGA